MKTLYIDTHLDDIHIILFDGKNIINEEKIVGKKQNSTLLMPTLVSVCPNKDFDQIIVVNGPGSFTGVRLGVTIAKTLAYTMNKKIYSLSYFELCNLSSNADEHYFVMEEKNGYYIAHYLNHELSNDIFYLNRQEYADFKEKHNVETDVAIDFDCVIDGLSDKKSDNPHAVNPIYVKKLAVEND